MPAKTGTLAHFKRWASELILDDGDPWNLEPFQAEIVRDILGGFDEVWAVIPEGNGKTTLMAGVALYHADTVPYATVPVGAAARDQARLMYRQAEGFVMRTPGMADRFRCFGGYLMIRGKETKSEIKVYSADDSTADGVIPTLALIDELHRHRNLDLYRTWRGKLGKRGGQLVTISTAGEPGSEFEETRASILAQSATRTVKGAHIRAQSDGLVLHDWAVRDREQATDLAVVAQANPRKALTATELRKKRSLTMTEEHWLRFTCNIATRESGQAITPEAWDALREPDLEPDRAAWSVGWLDLGWKIDTTAVGVLVWEEDNRRVIPDPVILEPPVDEADIVAALLDFEDEFHPFGWVYDPNAGAQQMAQLLEKGEHPLQADGRGLGITFIEHPQDNSLMATAAVRLDEAVRTGRLRHSGHPGLRRHVLNAVRKPIGGEKWRFDRPPDAKGARRSKYPIDALTGVLMGHSLAVTEHARDAVPLVAFA
jgi:phage terminase large subunit-like protein